MTLGGRELAYSGSHFPGLMTDIQVNNNLRDMLFETKNLKTSLNRVHGRCVSVKVVNVTINNNVNVRELLKKKIPMP